MNYPIYGLVQIRKQIVQRTMSLYSFDKMMKGIICIGIILRFAQYLFNRSLWIDESFLALNIINKSFLNLLQPLDYAQVAPVGFLLIEKIIVQLFSSSEYALRLFPLLSGIISLFLFYKLVKLWSKPEAALIAISLFAISDPLIYYSSELKPYSSDVAIAILLYLAAIHVQANKLTMSRIALFGFIGAIAIWFSFPSIFVLAGIGTSLTLYYLSQKNWFMISKLTITYLVWILSFYAFYLFTIRSFLLINKPLVSSMESLFIRSVSLSFTFSINSFLAIFENPVGLPVSGIAALTFIIGCISIFTEKKEKFFILVLPIFFTLLASKLHQYPFDPFLLWRLLLFIVPCIIIIIAEGLEQVKRNTKYNSAILRITIIVLIFFHPLASASFHLIKPRVREEIKPVMSYVKKHKQTGDLLYLYYASQYAFKYYMERYGFDSDIYEAKGQSVTSVSLAVENQEWYAPALPSYPSQIIVGVFSRDHWENYTKDLEKLRGTKRVWILFSHAKKDENKFFLYYLDSIGIRLDSFKSVEAAVYLYDLSK